MHTFKAIAQRSAAFGTVFALVASTVVPSAVALADELNPLTERSLLLTSSAPGYMDSDGSGNSESNPNAHNGGEYYSLPGSGPNGKKAGQTFSFRVSSADTVRAFTLQYCTTAAGKCQAPGDNLGDAREGATTPRETNEVAWTNERSDLNVTNGWDQGVGAGNFQIFKNGDPVASNTWSMVAENSEDPDFAHPSNDRLSGKNNFVTLSDVTGEEFAFNDLVEIRFTPSTDTYITNPGSGSFFVKMNTFSDVGASTYVNGGVTVANVMTDSIHITTKVLETMSFSVGTRNPDTQPVQHGSCDAMEVLNNNRLDLGNPSAENSLETGRTWDVNSYWRLSSNSSGGASVYYSGDTLRNTVGDNIDPMLAKAHSQTGTEQFGLAVIDAGLEQDDAGTFPANREPVAIDPLSVGTLYADGGTGSPDDINNETEEGGTTADNAQFYFNDESKSNPELIAENSDDVIRCATAKMRYIGNIAADTPAGVYTTKINYLAAPQY